LRGLETADIAVLATQIEDRLRSISESWEVARDLDTRMRDARHRIEKLVEAESEAKRSLNDWAARWSHFLPEIGMPVTATLEETEAALGVWDKLPGTLRERNNRSRRVTGMQRNIDTFESQANGLLSDISPDLFGDAERRGRESAQRPPHRGEDRRNPQSRKPSTPLGNNSCARRSRRRSDRSRGGTRGSGGQTATGYKSKCLVSRIYG
jgi:hypothetical protein